MHVPVRGVWPLITDVPEPFQGATLTTPGALVEIVTLAGGGMGVRELTGSAGPFRGKTAQRGMLLTSWQRGLPSYLGKGGGWFVYFKGSKK